jgi:hypothetical protein
VSASSEFAVQDAVFDALAAAAAVTAFVGSRIYDGLAPEQVSFPYILIGESNGQSFDTKTDDGMEQVLEIHTFSQYRGNKQARQIMGAVLDAIDRQALSVTGHDLVLLRYENSIGPFGDPDPTVRHGVQRFRVITEAQ